MKLGKIGKKISSGFKQTFGKKTQAKIADFGKKAQDFGKKALHQVDIGERKLVNSIHKIAPYAAAAADLYAPGAGDAILKADAGIGSLHSSARRVVKQLPKLGDKNNKEANRIAFGGAVDTLKADFNKSKKLLRDAKNELTRPAEQAPAQAPPSNLLIQP